MTTTTNYGMQLPSGTDPASITPINQNTTFLDTKIKELEDVTDSVIDEIDKTTSSVSGSVIAITDSAPNSIAKSVVASIEAQQASGTPTPANPLPISGFTEVNVNVCGKNLFNNVLSSAATTLGITYTPNADGSVTCVGKSEQGGGVTSLNESFTLPLGEYVLSGVSGDIALRIYFRDANNNTLWRYDLTSGEYTFTITDSVASITLRTVTPTADTDVNETIYPMIRPSTFSDDTYEPYINPTTTTLSWQTEAGTVYGGSIDLTSGVLTVTHKGVDLGDLTWTANANDSYTFNGDLPLTSVNGNYLESICSSYPVYNSNDVILHDYGISISYNGAKVFTKNKDYPNSDVNAFKTASQGVMLVYKLATPLTYQLTPQTIKLLENNNTIFSDTGDTNLTYVVSDKYSKSGLPTVEAVKSYVMEMLGM